MVEHNNTKVNLESVPPLEELKEQEEDFAVTESSNEQLESHIDPVQDNPLSISLDKLMGENKDLQGAKESFKLYQKNETDRTQGFDNHALFLLQAFRQCQDIESLNELKDLATSSPSLEARWEYLGWYTFHLNSLHQNEKILELLTNFHLDIPSENEDLLVSVSIAVINEYVKQNKHNEAIDLATTEISNAVDSKNISKLYTALSTVQTSQGDKLHANLSLDKALEYYPENTSLLFDSAYSASDSDLDDLSYLNYKVLTSISPNNASAKNNLGVRSFANQFKFEGTSYYIKASKLNNSLAYANLGYKLLNAGFIDLAKEHAEKGLATEDPSTNCHKLLSDIDKRQKVEEKQVQEYLSKAQDRQLFFRSYMSSRMEPINLDYDAAILRKIDNIEVQLEAHDQDKLTFSWMQVNSNNSDYFELELTRQGQSFHGSYKKVTKSENQYILDKTSGPFNVVGRFVSKIEVQISSVSKGGPAGFSIT